MCKGIKRRRRIVIIDKRDVIVCTGRLSKSNDKKATEDSDAAHKQAVMAEEDTFRGVHLDPNAHHWDEVRLQRHYPHRRSR